MLIIFAICPVAAPLKTVLNEKFIAQIFFVDFVGEFFLAVDVSTCRGGFQNPLAVDDFGIGIVKAC